MSTLVKLTKMVDLAVGSPEPGAVNFNILHSLLHVIIQQSQLQNTEVEFRGDDAYRVQSFLDAAPPFPSLKLSEYTILGDIPGSAQNSPASRPGTTNKKRDERSRRPEDDRKQERVRPKDSEHEEVVMTVVHHADTPAPAHQDEKKVVSNAKSGALIVAGKSMVRKISVSALEEQVEAKRKSDDRPPRDRDERSREKEDRPRDREERPRGKEDRPRDSEERPRGKEDRPRDKEERPKDREERPRDKDDRPRNRDERPREKDERPRDKEDRPRDKEDRPRDRDERPRDKEERPREKQERPRDRDEKPRDKDERGKDSRRDDARHDEDRGKSSRRDEPEKSHPRADIAQKSTTVVLVEHYDEEETEERPAHHQHKSHPVDKSKSSILKKTASATHHATSYQKLCRTVSELQTEVATLAEFHMPTNNELLESVRSKSTVTPIAEMWELIKLTKRMDGAETGINKLSTMIEDLAGESALNREAAGSVTKLEQQSDDRSERIKSLEKRLWEIENRMGTAERRLSSDGQVSSSHRDSAKRTGSASSGQSSPRGSTVHRDQKVSDAGPGSASSSFATPGTSKAGSQPASARGSAATPAKGGKPETAKVAGKVSSHGKDGKSGGSASLGGGSAEMVQTASGNLVKGGRHHQGSVEHQAPLDLSGLSADQMFESLKDEINKLRREVDDQKNEIKGVTQIVDRLSTAGPGISENELRSLVEQMLGVDVDNVGHMPMQRIGELEQRVNTSALQIHSIDQNYANQLEALQRQMNDMEKELGTILERINSGRAGGESGSQDFTGLGELYNKITMLQTDIDNVTSTSARLMDEREERQLHINALLEQIEVLKTVKADKEDLEDALADKADHTLMNRKVSHDQFDAACDDLSRGLEEALAKLTQQEMLWQQALDDVQREIENKLDKIEISPLKDFVNSKLKLLQERLKALAALRKETEAAGTKHKLLRNVNCISCDKDAVMKMEEKGHVASEPLPATRSMKPYLTYELDAVRKQQRRLPGSRNMNHFESAVTSTKDRDKSKEQKRHMETMSADHLCNRYCGGSHTITTPQQRVTRMGHFLAEYGPEAIPLRKAQRPRALSIADKTAMSKGGGLPAAARLMQLAKMANLGDSPGASPAGSPRTSGARPSDGGSIEVIKPPKHLSLASKTGSVSSAKPTTPTNGSSPPANGTPTKEATPPREGTPPTDEAPPPADDGGVIDEEAPPTEQAEEGGDIPEEGAEEGDAPPPSEDEAPAIEEAEPETAEPPADIPEAEAEAEPEPEAAPEPETAPEDPEPAEEPPPEE